MKGPLVAGLALVLLAAAGGAYLFLYSPGPTQTSVSLTNQSSSSTTASIPQTRSTQLTTRTTTTSTIQITNPTAQISVSALACNAGDGKCLITLVNSGGTPAEATSCTLNGLPGVFAPENGQVPPGGRLIVSCAPSQGGAVPIPGFHVEGFVQLSNGSSVHYTGNWA